MSLDADTLRQMIEEDEFGLLNAPVRRVATTPDERLGGTSKRSPSSCSDMGVCPRETLQT
jgi:hypothetical protein